jgi:hypothetical protein
MRRLILFAMLSSVLFAAPAWAINKCTDVHGVVSYQDEECPPGKSEKLKIDSTPQPQAGSDSYDGGLYSRGSGAVYTGPRGGHYTITPSGNRSYVRHR